MTVQSMAFTGYGLCQVLLGALWFSRLDDWVVAHIRSGNTVQGAVHYARGMGGIRVVQASAGNGEALGFHLLFVQPQ